MHLPETAPQTTSVRLRVDADLERCADILCRVYAASGYPVDGVDNPKKSLCTGNLLQAWVAERQGEVIGHAALYANENDLSVRMWKQSHQDEHVATLGKLFIDPQRQGGGAATALLKTAQSWGRTAGMRLVLFALIKDPPAVRLYERLGWIEFGRDVYRYGDGKQMEAVCFVAPEHKE
nr:putative n-acetyltransferase [Quercus suber]